MAPKVDGEWGVGAVEDEPVRPVIKPVRPAKPVVSPPVPAAPAAPAAVGPVGSSGEAGLDAVWLPLWPEFWLCIKKRELFDNESQRGEMGRGGS